MKDILIVEDGLQERERLGRLFSEAGYSVQLCSTVGEAERCVQVDNYKAAILDIGLSDKSGSYLFNLVKRGGKVSYVLIFTGNPSVHLKQRFLDEGAVDYVVKGSPQAQNEPFLARVKDLIGPPEKRGATGIALEEFLARYVGEASRNLFLDLDNTYPQCKGCGGREYVVVFGHQAQVPPEVHGRVACAACGKDMDPEVG